MLSEYVSTCAKHVVKKSWSLGDTLGGLLSSAIPIVAHYEPKWQSTFDKLSWQVPIFALLGAVVFRILAAPYDAWKEQKQAAKSTEGKLSELSQQVVSLKSEQPRLVISIESTVWGGNSKEFDRKLVTIMVIQVKVANTGKLPSAATNWRCFLNHETIGRVQANLIYHGGEVILNNNQATIKFQEKDALIVSGETPITSGEIRRGYVMARVNYSSELIESKPCTISLECDDVLGNVSCGEFRLDWIKDQPLQYIPGTRMSVASNDVPGTTGT